MPHLVLTRCNIRILTSNLHTELIKEVFIYQAQNPLFFTQMYFWGFFTVVLLFYSFIYREKTLRSVYLFLISLFFYYKSGGFFFSLLLISTITDYTIGWLIYRSGKHFLKKILVAISLIVNLGILAYFKYTYFFADLIGEISGYQVEVNNIFVGWSNFLYGSNFNVGLIILPVGISFYTFQTISYTIDVYRGKLKPVTSFIDFAFYVSFFPQLVAGPIVRASHFIPQIYRKYKLTLQEMSHALFLIMNGLIKKVLISDTISIIFVDRIFDDPLAHSGFENLMALYGYSLQIYCDFSGYTDIAIGVALLMGFRLPINFNSPYKARNLTDFWRRWHISLSTWLRDYLYIPLGGNRTGKSRVYVNIFITMLLGGLWHGANLKFVIWGGLHGIGLIFQKVWPKQIKPVRNKSGIRRFLNIFITFHFVVFLWLFFRAESWNSAIWMLEQILFDFKISLIIPVILAYKYIFVLIAAGFVIHWLPARTKEWYRGKFIITPIWIKLILFILLFFLLYQVKSTELQPFIYFRF